jgi:hypothetical protein
MICSDLLHRAQRWRGAVGVYATRQVCRRRGAHLDVSKVAITPLVFALVGIEARFLLTIPARVHVTPFAGATLAGVEEGGLAGW